MDWFDMNFLTFHVVTERAFILRLANNVAHTTGGSWRSGIPGGSFSDTRHPAVYTINGNEAFRPMEAHFASDNTRGPRRGTSC